MINGEKFNFGGVKLTSHLLLPLTTQVESATGSEGQVTESFQHSLSSFADFINDILLLLFELISSTTLRCFGRVMNVISQFLPEI